MSDEPQDQRDRQWARRIRDGDRRAFEDLFGAYVDELCAFAAEQVDDPTLGEDIVQDVFCDLWRRRACWEPRGTVRAYLYRAIRNTALDCLDRQQVRETWKEEEKRTGPRRFDVGPADALRHRELREAMEEAVRGLPDRQRLVYRLAHRHGLSYRETASALGIARKTVENHIGQALKSLRSRLTKYITFLQ